MKQQVLKKSPTHVTFQAQLSPLEKQMLQKEALNRFPELNGLKNPEQKAQEILHYVMGRTLERFLEKHPLELQKPPAFQRLKSDSQDLAFTAQIRLYPEVILPENLSVEIEVSPPKAPKPEDIQATLEALQWDHARIVRSELPAQAGDVLLVDTYLSQAGDILPQTAQQNQVLVLQLDRLQADWFDALLGVEAGQRLEIPFEMLLQTEAGPMMQATACHLLIKMVAQVQVARLDDHLAQKRGFASLDALLAETATALSQKKQTQWAAQVKEQVIQTLVAASRVEIPEDWLNEELEKACETSDIQNLSDFKLSEQTLDQLKSRWLKHPDLRARKAQILKTLLVLRAIIQQRGLKVEAPEIDAAIELMAAERALAESALKQTMIENHTLLFLAERILMEKVANSLMQTARIFCQGQVISGP